MGDGDVGVGFQRDGWQHALHFLDRLAANAPRVSRDELFDDVKEIDSTGVHEKHADRCQILYKKEKLDTVGVFSELVQMILAHEEAVCPEGFKEAFNVHKIEGYQYLTSRMQNRFNALVEKELLNALKHVEKQKTVILALGQKLEKTDDIVNDMKDNERRQDQKIQDLEKKIAALAEKTHELDGDQKNLAKATHYLKEDLSDFKKDVDRRLKHLEDIVERLRDQVETLLREVAKLKDKSKALDDRDDELSRRLDALEAKLRKFKDTLDHPPDFKAEIRRVEALVGQNGDNDDLKRMLENKLRDFEDVLDMLKKEILKNRDEIKHEAEWTHKTAKRIDNDHDKYVDSNDREIVYIKDKLAELASRPAQVASHGDPGLKKKIEELSDLLLDLQKRVLENKDNISDLNHKVSKMAPLLKDLHQAVEDMDRKFDKYDKDIGSLKKDQVRQDDEIHQLKNDFSKLKEKVMKLIDDLRDLNRKLLEEVTKQVNAKLSEQDDDIKANKRKIADLDRDLQDLLDKIKALEIKAKEKSNVTLIDDHKEQITVNVMKEMEKKLETGDKWKKLKAELDRNKEDVWAIMMKMYGFLRCNTLVIWADAGSPAEQKLPLALGVFRLIGTFNKHPLYKKDGGEMYLYFRKDNGVDTWMVSPEIGSEFAWLKNEEKFKTMAGPGGAITPDLRKGWLYQPMAGYAKVKDQFRSDDESLTCQPLKDAESINKEMVKRPLSLSSPSKHDPIEHMRRDSDDNNGHYKSKHKHHRDSSSSLDMSDDGSHHGRRH